MPRNERLRQQRIIRNWRQKDVADQLGTTVITIQRWERGTQQPSAYYRIKLCTLFGVNAQDLDLVEKILQPDASGGKREGAGQPVTPLSEELTLWTVPYARNPHFTGRDQLLDLLQQQFALTQSGETTSIYRAALTQAQAIKGLGGIGKTQIAVEYAYRSHEQGRYTHTLWIAAASEESILSSFSALVELVPALRSSKETDQRKRAAASAHWLEQSEQLWLLIVDNADDLGLIQPYLPKRGHGHILMTTRASAVGSLATSIAVDTMGVIEGTHLLLRRAQRFSEASDEEIDEAANLVAALGQFPLALDQAGAYIEETGCSVREYLHLYQHYRHTLLTQRGQQATGYPDSVATTWSLSFQRIEQANPAAIELLQLCAFLAPDSIPEELLIGGAPHWPPALQQAVTDRFRFNQTLEALLAFSFVKRLAENQTMSIHRLVQAVHLDRLSFQEQRQWAERFVLAMQTVFPSDPENQLESWPQCQRYLEQAQACDLLIQQYQIFLPEAADLLDRTGTYLRECALYTLTEPIYQRALRIREQVLSPEHSDTAKTVNNLANLYTKQGRYAEAESFYQRALSIWEQQVEPDYLQMASGLVGLAWLYRVQGRYVEAELLYQQAIHILEQYLGTEHPIVASSLAKLALVHVDQGRYVEAEPLYQQAIHILEQHLMAEHPTIVPSLAGLAHIQIEQGKYREATLLYQRALRIREQQLGPEHPDIASPLMGLAYAYTQQKKFEEAELLILQALRIREQQLGPEHAQVAFPLHELANLYQRQRKYVQAEPLYQRALHINEQQLGLESAAVSDPLRGLANLYTHQKKYRQAEVLFQRALHIREQKLGLESPETAQVLHDFAGLRQAQGQIQEALSFYQRALKIREDQLGIDHLITTETRERLHAVLTTLNQMEGTTVLRTKQQKLESDE